ncbi:deoxyuridine 5'-triphosphate nucleotidohydrolase [Neltuma alba]|uniref:deoxyuridine 5'-triphosphate nucleotidohydrolase n=1 Tax=Neltuma alba TaxID=207710 RepID=UPI0010A4829B|nr:deoxyuridine 5'-triphosphate nucleotidohydrolase-like [Prosopis alba]
MVRTAYSKMAGKLGALKSFLSLPLYNPTFPSSSPTRLIPFSFSSSPRRLRVMAQTEVQSNGCEVLEPSPKIQKVEHNGTTENTQTIMPFLRVKKLSDKAVLPSRASSLSAGYDLSSAVETKVPARGKALVATDLSIAIPEGTYARIAPRSGLAWKHSIDVGAGVIDADYRGPVGVILFNYSDADFEVKVGDRIAQLIIERIMTPEVEEVEDLDSTARGEGGFGSTGV